MTEKHISLPDLTVPQKIHLSILCALTGEQSLDFTLWATDWLSGKDRSEKRAKEVGEFVESVVSPMWGTRGKGFEEWIGCEKKRRGLEAAVSSAEAARCMSIGDTEMASDLAENAVAWVALNEDVDFIILANRMIIGEKK